MRYFCGNSEFVWVGVKTGVATMERNGKRDKVRFFFRLVILQGVEINLSFMMGKTG